MRSSLKKDYLYNFYNFQLVPDIDSLGRIG